MAGRVCIFSAIKFRYIVQRGLVIAAIVGRVECLVVLVADRFMHCKIC